MNRFAWPFLIFFLSLNFLTAEPPVRMPEVDEIAFGADPPAPTATTPSVTFTTASVTAAKGEAFALRFKVTGGAPKFYLPPGIVEAINLEELGVVVDAAKVTAKLLVGRVPGVYSVMSWNASGSVASDLAICTVTITGDVPPPKPPGPPGPVDPLTAALQAAYNLDKDVDRDKSLKFLQSAYSYLAANAVVQTQIKTNADALAWLKGFVEAPKDGLAITQVVNLRRAIATDMAATFGTGQVTPIDLTKLAAELDRISKSLLGVK